MRYYRRLNTLVIGEKVIKICTKPDSRREKLKVEMWAMEQARLQGMRVPKSFQYTRNSLGQEVLVMEYIDGKMLTTKITDESCMTFFDIGKQLGSLQRIYQSFGWIDPVSLDGVYQTWRDFLLDYTNRYGGQILHHGCLTQAELDRVIEVIEDEPLLVQKQSALVYRDLKPTNIISTSQGAYLIDWECAILGDPEYDLALYLSKFGKGSHWDNLVKGFGEIHQRLTHIYLILALIGQIDFCLTFKYGIKTKLTFLKELVATL